MGFFITRHCKDRYIERVCNGQNVDDDIMRTIINKIYTGKNTTQKIYDEVPRFILYLYEKYGELGQQIIDTGDVIFIMKKREGTANMFDVITCYRKHNHLEHFRNSSLSREEIFLKIRQAKSKLKRK